MTEPVVRTIGKYRVVERIASVPFLDVFKARLESIGGFQRTFAIKRVRDDVAEREAFSALVQEEAQVAGTLSHGNIVQLLDLGRDDDVLFLAMEFIDGWDLGDLLARAKAADRTMPLPEALHLAVEVLKGLDYAHQRLVDGAPSPVVHRAIMAGNILVGRRGEVKVTDFGLAQAALRMRAEHPTSADPLWPLCPEAVVHDPEGPTADVFALAAMLYEMLTGEAPFRRDTIDETEEALALGEVRPLSAHLPDAPEPLVALLAAAMSVDPSGRPEDARAFKQELLAIAHDTENLSSQEDLAAWVGSLFEAEPVEEATPATPAAPAVDHQDPALLADHTPERPPEEHVDDEVSEVTALPADATEDRTTPTLGTPKPAAAAAIPGPASIAVAEPSAPKASGPTLKVTPQDRKAEWDHEGATVVNPRLAKRLEAMRNERKDGWTEDEATRVRPNRTASVSAAPAAAPAEPVVVAAAPPQTSATHLVMGLVLLIVGMALGAVGLFLYQGAGGVAGPAHLTVLGTEDGVAVAVDGAPMAAGEALEPGLHRVEVLRAETPVYAFELTLVAGEHRVMTVDVPAAPAP